MIQQKYTIGIDFGTLSARALLVRVSDGHEMGSTVGEYPHAVMDEVLTTPKGEICLPSGWALEHPADYTEVLSSIVPALLTDTGISPDDVIAIGIDFTTSTVLPVQADGTPLCYDDAFCANPHAYVKLWKHHSPRKYADRLNQIAGERGEAWLDDYGGKISSEWLFPKLMETLAEAPEVYEAADTFMEAGDWITRVLTGITVRNGCMAGHKAIRTDAGDPTPDFLRALDPRLEHFFRDKYTAPLVRSGSRVGGLNREWADKLGLREGIAVTAALADAHVAVATLNTTDPGTLIAVMGTSAPMLLCSKERKTVPGICGVVWESVLPDLYGYEAGLGCMGDLFAWFAEHCCPADYKAEADALAIPLIRLLVQKMDALAPGESGLLALDWWNGNRSVLNNTNLTGLFLGMTLNTKPEELFRALIEATAFSTRLIIENYREHGVDVNRFIATGGIARKDPVTMQIYADVLDMDISVLATAQGSSLGTAIYAAGAAGRENGGYDSLAEACEHMGSECDRVYHPIRAHTAVYDKLYAEYKKLHDYFGRGGSDVMKRLQSIRDNDAVSLR